MTSQYHYQTTSHNNKIKGAQIQKACIIFRMSYVNINLFDETKTIYKLQFLLLPPFVKSNEMENVRL